MNLFKSVLFLSLVMGIFLTSCTSEEFVDNSLEKQEFVVFDELADLVPNDFDYKNEEHINALVAKADDDMLERLIESNFVAEFLRDNDLFMNHVEVFGSKMPSMDKAESILEPAQYAALVKRLVSKENSDDSLEKRRCVIGVWECIQVGWYWCHPCFCVQCPIMSCQCVGYNPCASCTSGQTCIGGFCYDPPSCDDNPCGKGGFCVNGECIYP